MNGIVINNTLEDGSSTIDKAMAMCEQLEPIAEEIIGLLKSKKLTFEETSHVITRVKRLTDQDLNNLLNVTLFS